MISTSRTAWWWSSRAKSKHFSIRSRSAVCGGSAGRRARSFVDWAFIPSGSCASTRWRLCRVVLGATASSSGVLHEVSTSGRWYPITRQSRSATKPHSSETSMMTPSCVRGCSSSPSRLAGDYVGTSYERERCRSRYASTIFTPSRGLAVSNNPPTSPMSYGRWRAGCCAPAGPEIGER